MLLGGLGRRQEALQLPITTLRCQWRTENESMIRGRIMMSRQSYLVFTRMENLNTLTSLKPLLLPAYQRD